MDTKNKVKIGEYSRGGENRIEVKALDHDFNGDTVVPLGMLLPKTDEVYVYVNDTKATADFMVDSLEDMWENNKEKYRDIKRIVLNQDNGPENSSRRTQFIKRIVEFSAKTQLEIGLAYYPPYHSKYNPVERVWGVLEMHWNGDLLDTKETVVKYIETMHWKGKSPAVKFVDKVYTSGQKLTKKVMKTYETVIERLEGLENWFVTIKPDKSLQFLTGISQD